MLSQSFAQQTTEVSISSYLLRYYIYLLFRNLAFTLGNPTTYYLLIVYEPKSIELRVIFLFMVLIWVSITIGHLE